jgi:hypothetical protein
MKKNYLFWLALACLLVACDKDDDAVPWVDNTPDAIAPVVHLKLPAMDDSVAIVYRIDIFAEVYDNRQLDRVKVMLGEPRGGNRKIADIAVIDFYRQNDFTLSQSYYIPKHTAPGMYTVLVEASDKAGNVTQQSTRVKLVAHDLSFAAFETPFYLSLLNSHLLEALDWFGYNHNDRGIAFDSYWFSTALFLMLSYDKQYGMSEVEWRRFTESFRLEGQTWSSWDKDRNEHLDEKEFEAGIAQLKLLEAWDKNQDKLIDHIELASGVFSSWDHNNDQILSKEEYLENFYTYLYSKRE